MPVKDTLRIVSAEGEKQKIEFKAMVSGLANDMVAFANASGDSIYLLIYKWIVLQFPYLPRALCRFALGMDHNQ